MQDKRRNKPDPFQFMIENRKMIIDIIQESPTLSKGWELLSVKLPEITQVTKFNTFKGYVRILKVIDSIINKKEILEVELGKVRQDLGKNLQELSVVKQEKDFLEIELGKVRQELSVHKTGIPNQLPNSLHKSNDKPVPKHVDGWGVQLKGNYYRLFKKIDGKLKWIHIGRRWDLKLAIEKIKHFQVR